MSAAALSAAMSHVAAATQRLVVSSPHHPTFDKIKQHDLERQEHQKWLAAHRAEKLSQQAESEFVVADSTEPATVAAVAAVAATTEDAAAISDSIAARAEAARASDLASSIIAEHERATAATAAATSKPTPPQPVQAIQPVAVPAPAAPAPAITKSTPAPPPSTFASMVKSAAATDMTTSTTSAVRAPPNNTGAASIVVTVPAPVSAAPTAAPVTAPAGSDPTVPMTAAGAPLFGSHTRMTNAAVLRQKYGQFKQQHLKHSAQRAVEVAVAGDAGVPVSVPSHQTLPLQPQLLTQPLPTSATTADATLSPGVVLSTGAAVSSGSGPPSQRALQAARRSVLDGYRLLEEAGVHLPEDVCRAVLSSRSPVLSSVVSEHLNEFSHLTYLDLSGNKYGDRRCGVSFWFVPVLTASPCSVSCVV